MLQVQKPNDISEINLEKDVKLKVSGGRDTDHQPGQDISKSYDGQFGGTCYHSTWNQSAKFPLLLNINSIRISLHWTISCITVEMVTVISEHSNFTSSPKEVRILFIYKIMILREQEAATGYC